jgi:hypothetical protein
MCRHKQYSDLLRDCSLLCSVIDIETKEIVGNLYITVDVIRSNPSSFRRILQGYLNPTTWQVDEEGLFTALRKETKL